MNFELAEHQKILQRNVREFAKRQVAPLAEELDREHRYPAEIVAQMAELGLMGVAVPEEYEGAGMDAMSYVVAVEEISAACASTGVIMSVNNSLVCDPILKFGTEEQKRTWLAPLASGRMLGCFGLSEPDAGSDAAAQRTVAEDKGDHFLVSGTKNFITNAHDAQVCVLLAMTDRSKGHRGISAFIAPMDAEGVSVGPKEDKLGIRASSTGQIIFDGCRLPKDALLGEVGKGFGVAMYTLDCGRIGIAAQALGIGRAALETALRYSGERKTFGRPIGEHQAIQFMLADMATRLDAARMLTYRAAILKDKGVRHSKESSMAKLSASEAANAIAKDAIQVLGGYGYLREYAVERNFRDAKITEIYEGTNEIQRIVIANALLRD
ncbi:MAG: acyl-CoA dehydrogenase [Polyangia bacterium]|jgi:butyryl-CoA dehydrogenase|nr:acyl-CoA dehydrogenase [Polyangia bacterium]